MFYGNFYDTNSLIWKMKERRWGWTKNFWGKNFQEIFVEIGMDEALSCQRKLSFAIFKKQKMNERNLKNYSTSINHTNKRT